MPEDKRTAVASDTAGKHTGQVKLDDTVLNGTAKPPVKAADSKGAPAASDKKPESPEKPADTKTAPAASDKKQEAPAKPADTKATPAASDKKPEAPAKPADTKATPATSDKKLEAPVKPADTKAASAANDKKPDTPAKPADTKTAPTASNKKQEAPVKPTDTKAAPTTSDKKLEAPAKPTDTKTAPTASDKKPEAPAKPADTKAAPAATDKKPEAPVKPADTKTAPAASDKKLEAPAKSVDTKTAPATSDKKLEAPAKPTDTKAAPTVGSENSPAFEPPKGIRVTQVFDDRLDKPDEAALKSLPIPQENEGFSMRLHPGYFFEFLDHPFTVNREVQDYKDLYESIKANGINEPVKARPREGGGLELLSGHRRHDIAQQLNYPVPVVIVREDDDSARIEVVDGNLHRQDIPTSELARAAKMKMEALARKAGRRSKMEQLSGPQKRTDQQVAEDLGMSRNQVQRLVRIDSLVPDLKQQVDDKKLPFNTAVELSYLKPDEQKKVVDFISKENTVPSMAQATELKKASQEAAKAAPPPERADTETKSASAEPKPAKAPAPLDEKKISSIVKPKAEPEIKYTFTSGELKEFFPNDKAPTVSEVKRTVFEALDMRKKAIARQKAKQAAKDSIKEK